MTLSLRARAWRGALRRRILLEAGCRAAGGSWTVFGLLALLDSLVALPRQVRLGTFALGWVWPAWVLVCDLWGPWRALGWEQVFDAVARKWPQTRLVIPSAWGLRAGSAGPGVSEELRAEHMRRADILAESLPDEPLERRVLSPAARRLAAAAAVVLSANLVVGDWDSWRRVLAPWRDAALERWLEVSPGDARLDWDSAATVIAKLLAVDAPRGLRLEDLVLEVRSDRGAWRAAERTREGAGATAAAWSLGALSAPLDYRLRWRDLTGRAYRLEPVAAPRWRRAVAEIRGSRARRRFVLGEEASLRARRGDWISIEAEPEALLASAAARLSGRPPLPMRLEGGRWKAGFPAAEDSILSFELVDAEGRRDPSPPAYALSVEEDAPPVAELLGPQVPLVASPEDFIKVAYSARDDGAVVRVWLVVRVPGRPDRIEPLASPNPPLEEVLGEHSWSLEGLAPGTRAEFWVEAADDALPPQTARSEKGLVEIVDVQAAHRAALAARAEAQVALERSALRAEAARDASLRGDLASSRAETAALGPEWTEASRALSEWSRRSAADPRGDPDLAGEAARAAEEFARAQTEGLAEASRALGASDLASAGREQAALAEQARGVQRAVKEGASAQSVQDMAGVIDGARRASEAMSRRAEGLAARGREGTVSSAEFEALETELFKVEEALEALRRAVRDLPEASPESSSPLLRSLSLEEARGEVGQLRRALSSGDVAAAAKAAKRLAERLGEISKALQQAGRRAVEERSRRGQTAADAVRRSWREAVDAQTGATEDARALEEFRNNEVLSAQRVLLAELHGRQEAILSSAAVHHALWPEEARRSAVEVARQFHAGAVVDAVSRLRSIAALLRRQASLRPAEAASLLLFAEAEQSIAERLGAGVEAAALNPEKARGAAQAQTRARQRVETLREEIVRLAREIGFLPGGLLRQVGAALAEQAGGERALRRGDSTEGLRRAEAALAILQEGGGGQDRPPEEGSSPSDGSGQGGGEEFVGGSVRSWRRGSSGASLGRVRLPSADDYRPPRELREELERSLGEPRPDVYDPEIKEYFKRLAR